MLILIMPIMGMGMGMGMGMPIIMGMGMEEVVAAGRERRPLPSKRRRLEMPVRRVVSSRSRSGSRGRDNLDPSSSIPPPTVPSIPLPPPAGPSTTVPPRASPSTPVLQPAGPSTSVTPSTGPSVSGSSPPIGSQYTHPETAERLSETQHFVADNPEITPMAPLVCYRPYTAEVDSLPLPPASYRTKVSADKHYPIAALQYQQLTEDIKKRVRDAKDQIARNKGMAKFNKPGRKGSKVITKRPPSGKRVVLEWSEAPKVPIGEWGIRFNNLVGCLVKRADFINPFFKFYQQPFKSIEDIWRELMKSYCLEDNEFAWDYLFGPDRKIQTLIRNWRNDLKTLYYVKIQDDWERFWKLDPRVDFYHFAALLIYWDSPKNKDNSAKASSNRGKMEYDHFLGPQSFAQIEHRYKRETGNSVMPVNLLVQKGYTHKSGYDKLEKLEKIKKMQDEVDTAVSQKLQEPQSEMNPHLLSREQNDMIIEDVFGPPKKGRHRLRGSGSYASSTTTTSFEPTKSSMPSTAQQQDESREVLNLRYRVVTMLNGKLDPTVFAQIMPLIFGDIGTPRLSNAVAHIVHSLHGKIPDNIYVDVITSLPTMNDSSADYAQSREVVGSTNARSVRDDDAVDLGVHHDGKE